MRRSLFAAVLACTAVPAIADQQWNALLHYRTDGAALRSQADRSDFFVSPAGRESPPAELQASLDALAGSGAGAFACRFPARYEYLVQRYHLALAPDAAAACPEVAAWLARFQGDRISINFASSYLESPSSMFGHTFLKVDHPSGQQMLSQTLNYAAHADQREGDLSFIRKGLFGGFPGKAEALPLYRRLRIYADTEGRDVWEYQLLLSPAERRRLLLHALEIRDAVFDYYFIDENCAYRTLALVDVARPGLGLLDGHQLAAIPVDTIRTLQAHGILGPARAWPALPKQLRAEEQRMGPEKAALAARLANGVTTPSDLAGMTAEARQQLLRFAYLYGSLQVNRDVAERGAGKAALEHILDARFGAAGNAAGALPAAPTAPEKSHRSHALAAGLLSVDGRAGMQVAWAGFQHSLLDPLAGNEANSAITVLRPELRIGAGHGVQLARIDWLRVQSAVPSTALFPSSAWEAGAVTQMADFDGGRHRMTRVAVQRGWAWQAGRAVVSVLPGAALDLASPFQRKVAIAGLVSARAHIQRPAWAAQLAVDVEAYAGASHLRRRSASAALSWHMAVDTTLTFAMQRKLAPLPRTEMAITANWFH